MYYCLVHYPQLDPAPARTIDAMRQKYDPTVACMGLHVTVVFPVPESVGETRLIGHIEDVLRGWSPFEIRPGDHYKSHDHWLLLKLAEGEAEVKRLYRSLYSGILAEYRRDDLEFVPHLGLGLFVRKGVNYDWDHPREDDLDRPRYEEAVREAEALSFDSRSPVERLHLVTLPDEILEWATGGRESIPEECRVTTVREFRLS
jgi:2'-5' RNA ligase